MIRDHFALCVLLGLALASPQLLAKTSALQTADSESAVAIDTTDGAGANDDQVPVSKPAAKKPTVSPTAKGKQSMQYRANGGNASRTPRWHRFLPGMFR